MTLTTMTEPLYGIFDIYGNRQMEDVEFNTCPVELQEIVQSDLLREGFSEEDALDLSAEYIHELSWFLITKNSYDPILYLAELLGLQEDYIFDDEHLTEHSIIPLGKDAHFICYWQPVKDNPNFPSGRPILRAKCNDGRIIKDFDYSETLYNIHQWAQHRLSG
jgi:hypothetical protein